MPFLRLCRRLKIFALAVKLFKGINRIIVKESPAVQDRSGLSGICGAVYDKDKGHKNGRLEMNTNGIGTAARPAWYEAGKSGRNVKTDQTGNAAETDFFARMVQERQAAGTRPTLVLHGKNDADEGETVVGSSIDARTGASIAVYRPQDFDADNPVYHVKVWDSDGNMTEQMVDLSKIDPKNSNEIEMSAYAWHLSSTGKCPNAFLNFAGVRSHNQTEEKNYSADSAFKKFNWMNIVKDFMQMQYDAHNMKGYLDYKKLLGFMETDLFADAAPRSGSAGQEFDAQTVRSGKKTAMQYWEQSFDRIGPNAPESVRQAWMEAAAVAGTDGMGVTLSGKLSHISQLMVRKLEKGYSGEQITDLMGNSVQSAVRAAKEALYALEHPLAPDRGRTMEEIMNREKEKLFYQEFIKRLSGTAGAETTGQGFSRRF